MVYFLGIATHGLMEEMPSISIVTASYNAAGMLANCLHSVSEQDVNAEHILVDGGSDDGTLDVVEQYRSSLAKVVSEPDRGVYDAMNKGVELATGDVIGTLNADDYYASAAVLAKVSEVFSNPEVDACYGDLVYVDQQDAGKVTRFWHAGKYTPRKLYWGWMPPHPTFFVRRSVYERYGLFNLGLGSAADYELMLRFLLKHQITTTYIPDVLVHMRTGGLSNASVANRFKANLMDRKAWAINGLRPYPWTLWAKPLRKIGQWVVK